MLSFYLFIYIFQNVSYDLTKGYLDLVTNYVTLMILLSRVEDRKAVLGLFNAAHEMVNNQGYEFFSFLYLGIFLTCHSRSFKNTFEMRVFFPLSFI